MEHMLLANHTDKATFTGTQRQRSCSGASVSQPRPLRGKLVGYWDPHSRLLSRGRALGSVSAPSTPRGRGWKATFDGCILHDDLLTKVHGFQSLIGLQQHLACGDSGSLMKNCHDVRKSLSERGWGAACWGGGGVASREKLHPLAESGT
ncbi:uncharacterized protein LOC740665 isoform X1 [Pan troglodytes]|uniref:uncharacterized protein LOC740665 isoform X1 n=1 Tax=Pan troglodytes TaxID=9598 RepID=UPI00001C0914|nr:unnamed protein product [Homo sapiens]